MLDSNPTESDHADVVNEINAQVDAMEVLQDALESADPSMATTDSEVDGGKLEHVFETASEPFAEEEQLECAAVETPACEVISAEETAAEEVAADEVAADEVAADECFAVLRIADVDDEQSESTVASTENDVATASGVTETDSPEVELPSNEEEWSDDDPNETVDASSDSPGGLLRELERRQDEVLDRLDQLNARIESVLLELGIRLDDEADVA